MPWYTTTDAFGADVGVDEWHGTNPFEALGSTWSYLDITALGRQKEWEDLPKGYPQTHRGRRGRRE
jgi:predicted dithiol-disulfide oxidoreductase (DUF899 family)